MKNETIEKIENKLNCEVIKRRLKNVDFDEILHIIRATTTFHQVINMICNYDKNMTIFELKENSTSLNNIFIDVFRINEKINIE